MSKHRADVRPRWGRIVLSTAAAGVVVVSVIGAAGAFEHHPSTDSAGGPAAPVTTPVADVPSSALDAAGEAPDNSNAGAAGDSSTPERGRQQSLSRSKAGASGSSSGVTGQSGSGGGADDTSDTPPDASSADVALPAGSGEGRRAVFSQSEQRVWIVETGDHIARTYLVSGSVEDNLEPGTYSVYSRSEQAWGIDDSGTMKWFVRFAHGTDSGAAIGFHSIPTKDGQPLETVAQLGTPQSHGCIRQKTEDALAMWAFAQIGTKVVVVA